MKKPLHRWLIYFVAFATPPFLIGTLTALATFNQAMTPAQPSPVTKATIMGEDLYPAQKAGDKRLHAIIVVSTKGAQISETLIPYEILSQSDRFFVQVAAPTTQPIPLTSGLAIYPDLLLDDAPKPDVLVLPSQLESKEASLADYVRNVADEATWVVSLGEGIRVLGETGWLNGHKATTHPHVLDSYAKEFSHTEFVRDRRAVLDEQFISGSGVGSSGVATRVLLEKLFNEDFAKKTLQKMRAWSDLESPLAPIALAQVSGMDLLSLALRVGFIWGKASVGVLLYPGISEWGLASVLDTLPRSFTTRTVTLSSNGQPLRTRNGLTLLPALSMQQAPPLELLVVPPGDSKRQKSGIGSPLQDSSVQEMLNKENTPVKSFQNVDLSQTPSASLDLLRRLEGSGAAEIAAKLQVLPEWSPEGNSPTSLPPYWQLCLRILAIGLMGILLARTFERRLRQSRDYANLDTSKQNQSQA